MDGKEVMANVNMLISNSKFVEISDAKHLSFFDNPKVFFDTVISFLLST